MEPRSSRWVMEHTTSAAASWAAMAAVATANDGSLRSDASPPAVSSTTATASCRRTRRATACRCRTIQTSAVAATITPRVDEAEGHGAGRRGWSQRQAQRAGRDQQGRERAAEQGGVAGHVDPLGNQRHEAENRQHHHQGHAGPADPREVPPPVHGGGQDQAVRGAQNQSYRQPTGQPYAGLAVPLHTGDTPVEVVQYRGAQDERVADDLRDGQHRCRPVVVSRTCRKRKCADDRGSRDESRFPPRGSFDRCGHFPPIVLLASAPKC